MGAAERLMDFSTEDTTTVDGFKYQNSSDRAIVQLLNQVYARAARSGVSDIHIEDEEYFSNIRFRIDGILQVVCTIDRLDATLAFQKICSFSELPDSEVVQPQDGKMRVTIDGHPIDARISIIPTVWGRSIVCRLLDSRNANKSLEDIPMPPLVRQNLMTVLGAESGMLLLTGPTGSGKTTTLYACLNHLNNPTSKLLTIEEPVEYTLKGVQQIPVTQAVRFSTVLRAALRHDPDVILLGEIRDEETARIATQGANTGHLMLSTLHTNDAPSTIKRLLDLGLDAYTVGTALKVVIAQRLLPKLCHLCAQKRTANPFERNAIQRQGFDPDALYGHAVGCEHCDHRGIKGRLPIMEMAVMDDDMRTAMEENRADALYQVAANQRQYRKLSHLALDHALAGTVDLKAALSLSMEFE